jgi:hypothetical protein
MIVFLSFANLFSQDLTYVGAGKCKMCHKSEKQGQQFPLWEARKHSKAFQALSADTAAEKAKEAGVEGNPAESPKCLNCHGPITEFKQEGVTCEACHGPGSAYKKMSVMKDQAEAIKKGLTPYGSPEAIKKQCLKCHENAHGSSFDFDAAWEKVKHAKPEK